MASGPSKKSRTGESWARSVEKRGSQAALRGGMARK